MAYGVKPFKHPLPDAPSRSHSTGRAAHISRAQTSVPTRPILPSTCPESTLRTLHRATPAVGRQHEVALSEMVETYREQCLTNAATEVSSFVPRRRVLVAQGGRGSVDPFFERFKQLSNGRIVGPPSVQHKLLRGRVSTGQRGVLTDRTFFFSSHGLSSRM